MLHKLREILHVYKISLQFVQIPFQLFLKIHLVFIYKFLPFCLLLSPQTGIFCIMQKYGAKRGVGGCKGLYNPQ